MGFIPEYNDYTTIWHRVHDMVPEIKLPTEKDLWVATDGSGLKTNNAGEYRIFKYGEKTVSRSKNGLIAEAIQRFWNDLLREYGMNKIAEMT